MFNPDSLFIRKNAGKDLKAKAPEKGAARFFFLAWTHFAKLVGLNMLFLLFCVPVITIPAALSGMNRVCLLLVREGTASVWKDFIKEFRLSFLKSLPLGFLSAFLLADAALCVFLGLSSGSAGMTAVLVAAAAVLAVFSILMTGYSFVLLPLIALKNTDILRDALSLIFLEPKAALLLLLVDGGGLAAAVLLLPYSVPVIAVLWPSLLSLATCTLLHEPIKNRIIDSSNIQS